ncbi:hypothetical protein J7M00_04750 [bacterium]|nr:hypothetical protein [bacterium]
MELFYAKDIRKLLDTIGRIQTLPKNVYDGKARIFRTKYGSVIVEEPDSEYQIAGSGDEPEITWSLFLYYREQFMESLGFGEERREEMEKRIREEVKKASLGKQTEFVCPVCGKVLDESEYVFPVEVEAGSVFNGQRWDTRSETSYISVRKCSRGHGYFVMCKEDGTKELISEKKEIRSFDIGKIEVTEQSYILKPEHTLLRVYKPISIRTRYYVRIKLKDTDIKAAPAAYIIRERHLSRIVIETAIADLIWFDIGSDFSSQELKVDRKGDERITRLFRYERKEV